MPRLPTSSPPRSYLAELRLLLRPPSDLLGLFRSRSRASDEHGGLEEEEEVDDHDQDDVEFGHVDGGRRAARLSSASARTAGRNASRTGGRRGGSRGAGTASVPSRRQLARSILLRSVRIKLARDERSELPLRIRPAFVALNVLVLVFLALLGFHPRGQDWVKLNDKLLHFVCFFFATGMFYMIWDVDEPARTSWFWRKAPLYLTFLTCFAVGGLGSEIVQSWLPYKTFQIGDVIANMIGSSLGLFLSYQFELRYRYRREVERLYQPLGGGGGPGGLGSGSSFGRARGFLGGGGGRGGSAGSRGSEDGGGDAFGYGHEEEDELYGDDDDEDEWGIGEDERNGGAWWDAESEAPAAARGGRANATTGGARGGTARRVRFQEAEHEVVRGQTEDASPSRIGDGPLFAVADEDDDDDDDDVDVEGAGARERSRPAAPAAFPSAAIKDPPRPPPHQADSDVWAS